MHSLWRKMHQVVQKKYIYFGYWKYTKNSSLPLILIRKTCKAIGQDNRVIKLHHLCVDMEQLPDKWEWRTLNVTVVLQYQYYIGIWKTFDSNMPEKIKVQSSTPCSINLSEQMRPQWRESKSLISRSIKEIPSILRLRFQLLHTGASQ